MPSNLDKGTADSAEALWYVAAGKVELRSEIIPPPAAGEVRIRTLASGISRGTESLVFNGAVPQSEWQRMRAPFQMGDFPYPVKYGYACVGLPVADPAAATMRKPHEGAGTRPVFVLYPHQTLFNAPETALVPIPDGLPVERAVLAANMETALTGLWDGMPSTGDHITVVGGGVVGLLTAWLASRIPGTRVTLVDTAESREEIATALGFGFAPPGAAPLDQDLVIHASGHPEGLQTALRLAGDEACVLEMSWFGERPVTLPLGGAFHSRRLTLKSSQVGRIPPSHRTRWSYRRRLELALSLLRDDRLDLLLAPPISFLDLPDALPSLLAGPSDGLAHVIRYPLSAFPSGGIT